MNALAEKLQKADIIRHGDFTLRGGQKSSYYFDVKKSFGEPTLFESLIRQLSAAVPDETTCIVASGYGGIALATGVALLLKKPLTLVREVEKDHGTRMPLDGYVPTERDRVCVIDDVITTGSTIRTVLEKLVPTNCIVADVVVVLSRNEVSLPVSITALISSDDLISL